VKELKKNLTKKVFLLLILIAALWWWHFYRMRFSRQGENLISNSAVTSEEQIKNIKEKEKKLNENLTQKAENAFKEDYGRNPASDEELIEKGYISKESILK